MKTSIAIIATLLSVASAQSGSFESNGNSVSVQGNNANLTINGVGEFSGTMAESNNMTWTNITGQGEGFEFEQQQGYATDDSGESYMRQVQKFDQYFNFAIDHMNAAPGTMVQSCASSSDCVSNYDKHCCVNVVMRDGETGRVNNIYRCMTEAVADANMQVSIEGWEVQMSCIGGASGAASMAASGIAALGLAGMALF